MMGGGEKTDGASFRLKREGPTRSSIGGATPRHCAHEVPVGCWSFYRPHGFVAQLG